MTQHSDYFKKTFSLDTNCKTDINHTVIVGNYRFSILTSRLLRVEKANNFVDKATQAVLDRNFDKPEFKVIDVDEKIIKIATTKTVFTFDLSKGKMLSVALKGGNIVTDFKKGNLKGTRRTLDATRGEVAIGDGLMSVNGVSVVDDKKSLILNSDGTISEREKCEIDDYYFAYGNDFRGCLKDFFKLCGEVPLVPRYCLGNWWSRYKAYTQEEYQTLMKRFVDEKIPITVATIDMDWHWVNIVERFGKEAKYQRPKFFPQTIYEVINSQGWTGYSWNTDLFPDYRALLKWLQDQNFKVTVNLHPAQGVRFFEDQYEEMAKFMGVDPTTKKQIDFDIADPKFIDAYFNILHRPFEDEGVDFWWIDWQQGKNSKIKDLDPLWALNHYHTMANQKDNNRPLILSRFAQIGSHRYPLGFSGDTSVNWDCFKFQPYFTSTATNVGYTWWSHDIGGHHLCKKDDELYLRWVQFGAFSPINRLHSTSNEFMGKEPWKYNFQADKIAVDFLKQRHKFIPYTYSMNYQTHKNARAICEPMYYEYADNKEAYNTRDQYFFGTELIAAPITDPVDALTNLASVNVWLPKGRWTDVYTGAIYEGEKRVEMYRGIESFPLLAKEGAIIPLSVNDTTNDSSNPVDMQVKIYRGENTFELYEDDGLSNDFKSGKFAITKFRVSEKLEDLEFDISKVIGDKTTTVQSRNYTLEFCDVTNCNNLTVEVNGKSKVATFEIVDDKVIVNLKKIKPTDSVHVSLNKITVSKNVEPKEEVIELVTKYQLGVINKQRIYNKLANDPCRANIPNVHKRFKGPLEEVFEKM